MPAKEILLPLAKKYMYNMYALKTTTTYVRYGMLKDNKLTSRKMGPIHHT